MVIPLLYKVPPLFLKTLLKRRLSLFRASLRFDAVLWTNNTNETCSGTLQSKTAAIKKKKVLKNVSQTKVTCNQPRLYFARGEPPYLQAVESFKLLTGDFLWPFQK